MYTRHLGRTGWSVSEIGYGMWGLAGWSGSDDSESLESLHRSIELGCNFFDTAWGYGKGHSESILGRVVREHPEKTLYVATKIPPKNFTWPSRRGFTLEDAWAEDERWQRAMSDLKAEGLIKAVGISVNRWEPDNVVKTLETGLIDVVQVIYNIFDQAPRDELLPLCEKLDIGVIARVPFDEGTLTGTLTQESTWPETDWRSTYFVPENLQASVDHA
jgi:aryl-alcohol dehydrogenase-like predicted oxidoreductase